MARGGMRSGLLLLTAFAALAGPERLLRSPRSISLAAFLARPRLRRRAMPGPGCRMPIALVSIGLSRAATLISPA